MRNEQTPDWMVAGLVRSAMPFFTEKPDDPIMNTTWSYRKVVEAVRKMLIESTVDLNKREIASASPTIAYRAANEIGAKSKDGDVEDLVEAYTFQYLADKAFQKMTGTLERSPVQTREWWDAQHRKKDIERSKKERGQGGSNEEGKPGDTPHHAGLAVAVAEAGSRRVYVGIDGDDIGSLVEETLRTDDPEAARQVSQKIHEAHKGLRRLIKDRGGKVIFDGGDNMLVYVGFDTNLFEEMRQIYVDETGHTATVGVGARPVEAHYALVVGKNTGKDRVVVYDKSVAQQAEQIRHEQEELEPQMKKLKYKAEADIEADEKIKGAMWELNMDVTDSAVYDILMRLVERFGLDRVEDLEQFFAKDRETLKQSIREVYARRLNWSIKVASRMATREERRALVDAMVRLVAAAREVSHKGRPLAELLHSTDPHLVQALLGLEDSRSRILKSSISMSEIVDASGTPWSGEMSEVEGKAAVASSLVIPYCQEVDLAMKALDNAQVEHLGEVPEMPVDTRGVIERASEISRILAEAATLIELAAVAAKADPQVIVAGNTTIDRENRKPGQDNIPSGRRQKSPHSDKALTIEERNKDQVDWTRTDLTNVGGNSTRDSQQFSMGGEPGEPIATT